MTNPKRFIILAITLIATILAIVLGSFFYISKNVKKGIEYGGGAEYVVKINVKSTNVNDTKKIATDVAESIYGRIDSLGVAGALVNPEITSNGASVRVQYPGLVSENDVKALQELITSKPHLVFTDIYGNLLFDQNGNFNPKLHVGFDPGKSLLPAGSFHFLKKIKSSSVPIINGGARAVFSGNGKHQVEITVKPSKGAEWTKATSYISQLNSGKNQIIAWLNLDKLITNAKTNHAQQWDAAKHNPYIYIHVNNNLKLILKKYQFDASQFMISAASVKSSLPGRKFVIDGNFNANSASLLAKKIIYGVSDYSLKTISSNQVDASYGSSAFQKSMIAGLIVFSLIALFLIMNYGLLGVLSTISIALYMFLTLIMFTVMRGEYSPETIAALIIGIGMSVDANIITFERLKSDVYRGSSIIKSNKNANRRSLTTIFDANITTLIVAFVLFFFGTRSIVGLSVMLILSIFFTLIVMLIFTRVMATLLVSTGLFENKKRWIGITSKFDNIVQSKIDKLDYVKSSKWFVITSGILISLSVIIFAIFAGIAGTLSGGLNLSQDFTGGTIISISNDAGNNLNAVQVQTIKTDFKTAGAPTNDIHTIYKVGHQGETNQIQSLKISTTKDIDQSKLSSYQSSPIYKYYNSSTTSDVAKKLVKDAMLAIVIAMVAIVIYTLIRFKWTYSFSAIVALVHDGLIVTAIFIITRVQISPVFVAGLLSIIGYSINDTIVTFDRIREKVNASVGELNKKTIKRIANEAIKDTLKRSLLSSFTTVMAVLILMMFGNATKLSFNLAMLIGLIAGTYSSIFIATYLWVKLETIRQKKMRAREKNDFWKTKGVEEQTFNGINDFIA